MHPPPKLTRDTVERIQELLPVCGTSNMVAAMANVRKDIVSCVKNGNYVISDEVENVEQDKEGCFSWKDYPRGCY